MCTHEDSNDRLCMAQMNSELERAQLELLAAHCATHQLRVHYSTDDLARFGRRDVLRKSVEAASSLNAFYLEIEKKFSQGDSAGALELTPDQVSQAIEGVSSYLYQQRERYFPVSHAISNPHKSRMWPYFSAKLLEQVRVIQLHGERVTPPPFYAEARALGFDNLPEITHMESLTFLDVVVFNEALTERSLFHGLVHAVQFHVLGARRYTELFVKSFLKTRAHFTVPLEAHAFTLESKFMRPSAEKFSVEDHVHRWVTDGRY